MSAETPPPRKLRTNDALSAVKTAIRCEDLRLTFRSGKRTTVALDGVSLSVKRGGVTGLIGPDGAGKTTLMRLCAGLLHPDEGELAVLGLNVAKQALRIQASVGYMPQRFGLYEDLTVQENLDLYADLQGVPHGLRADRYAELMHMTGLAPFTTRLAGRLSGGMKQKLGLACTLVHPPELLLLDEPTVGVDPVSRRELWQIVYRFVKEEGTTVLLSTAYLDEAARCDDVIILNEGTLLGQGPPSQFSEPLTGRTFLVRAPGEKNRDVQEQLAALPDVTDAVIQGDAVRLVMSKGVQPPSATLFPGKSNVKIEPVPPRFEDGFITMLRERLHDETDTDSSPTARGNNPPSTTPTALSADDRVIEVHNVQRRFGSFYAVKGVSFDVQRGEVFGLLGANGAGKTTTFRMLCGLLPASAGQLRVSGIDVRRAAAAARARIGYMSQKFSLYGTLSVAQNLRFFSSAYGLKRTRRAARISWAVEQFELQSVLDVNSGMLPLGYKQRLALACALMHEPDIVFLDEPTSGVDPLARREFWSRINGLASRGVTVLVTTHFMEEAEYCDRMAIMIAGEIVAVDTPQGIKAPAESSDNPDPSMEDAFIHLIESHDQAKFS
ncbi:MAG: ATP-binding cassette domain-containing protein [Planctomycetaceae bacterium]